MGGFKMLNNSAAIIGSHRKTRAARNRRLSGCVQTLTAVISIAIAPLVTGSAAFAGPTPFIPAQGSTSPANGDLNPYGLAVVPSQLSSGLLRPGKLIVSNFNNSLADGNVQGKGRTIVIIDQNTAQQLGVFFQGTHSIGFTNALAIVKAGFVFAGSVFTTSQNPSAQNGGLLVLDSQGHLVTRILNGTNGPWGLAIDDRGSSVQLFISNVLDGTITRIVVSFSGGFVVGSPVTIASGYSFGPDSAGLVVGPAGLAYNSKADVLFVASEDDNAIYAIAGVSALTSSAGKGTLIYDDQTHLHGPLGLIIAPNGNLITANADPAAHVDPNQPSEIVEFTTGGSFVRQFSIDPNTGSSFAILNVPSVSANQFSYVDDFSSIINILRLSK
jgi:hypothetical protein